MSDGKTIAGRSPRTVVQLAAGVNPAQPGLTAEEGVLLSRAGGGMTLAELVATSKLAPSQVELLVSRLLGKRLLVERSDGGDAPDLSLERQKEVLALETRLSSRNLFEHLGVPNGASIEACKSAYYDLSMKLHPDRFYGKNLGSFRTRIERVFQRVTEAQQVLTDRDKRAAYERANPTLFKQAVTPAVHDGMRADDRARRIARHPYLAKAARTHELLGRARQALASGQAAQAVLDLDQLLKLDPNHVEAKRLLGEATTKKDAQRGAMAYDEAIKYLAVGDSERALRRLLEALEKAPTKDVCTRGTDVALEQGDIKNAKGFAQKWVELEPRSAKAHLALAEILERLGLQKNAKREAEEALKLDPENKVAKALFGKLRWA